MKTRRFITAGIVIVSVTAIAWFSSSLIGAQRIYEIDSEVTVGEYKTDATRAIDAYERLAERSMAMNQATILQLAGDIQKVLTKLEAIDKKLASLDQRLGRIERGMGVKPRVKEPRSKKSVITPAVKP